MDHNNYIFPTKLTAAKYLIKNSGRIEFVQYNTLAPTSLFPKLENISRFGSLEEAQRFVEDFGNSEEVFRFDESEVLRNNAAYIGLGWIFNPKTGVWRIDQDKYHRVMGIISYKIHHSKMGPALLESGGRFASNGGRFSAASGGGGRLSAASGGGRLSSVRGLESNINDILTGFDERKLRIIGVQAHVLSKGGNRLIVKTDNIINKLSAVIAEDGIREWTARNKSHAISRKDKIKELRGEIRHLVARKDELQRTQRNAALSVENKYEIVHDLEQISGEIIRREREIVELSTEQLPPYSFNDIDREIQSLAIDILESNRHINSEETRLGRILSYPERVQVCSAIEIIISEFDERIKHIALMSASYKASEYYLEERRNVRKAEIEKKIALLDLWRLSITYSNTQPGVILSQLNMYEPMEDLTALAEYNEGYREDLYQGTLREHGRGLGIEALRRLSTTLRDGATRALEGLARVIEAQTIEGQGPHEAVVSEVTPVIQEAGGIVQESLKNISRILSRRRTGRNYTRRNRTVPSLNVGSSAGGVNSSPTRNSRKRGRVLTPPESPESNGRANVGGTNAGTIPLQQAMNRGSLENVLAAGEAYNGNLPEVPIAGVNEFGIPFQYSSPKALANKQRRRTNKNRNSKKPKPRNN